MCPGQGQDNIITFAQILPFCGGKFHAMVMVLRLHYINGSTLLFLSYHTVTT